MSNEEYPINENVTLKRINEKWIVDVNGNLLPAEKVLDLNANEEVCFKIKEIIDEKQKENLDTLEMVEEEKLIDEESRAKYESKQPSKKQSHSGLYSQPEDIEKEVPATKKGEVKLLDMIYDLIDQDLIEFFGKTGTGKTHLAIQAAIEAKQAGKSVYYYDIEKNIPKKKIKVMQQAGVIYSTYDGEFKASRDLDKLHESFKTLPKYDLVVIDSIGLPVLSVYCNSGAGGQGEALKKMIAMASTLKSYANKTGALVIAINQPESDMNKDQNTERRSFGDKAEYFFKEMLMTKFAVNGKKPDKTTIVVQTYRSRSYGMGTTLFTAEITDNGVKIIQ